MLRRPVSSDSGSSRRDRDFSDPEREFDRDLPLEDAETFTPSSSPTGDPIPSVVARPRGSSASRSGSSSGLQTHERHFAAPTRPVAPMPHPVWAVPATSEATWLPLTADATRLRRSIPPDQSTTAMVIPTADAPNGDRHFAPTQTDAVIEATAIPCGLGQPLPAGYLPYHRRVRQAAVRLVGGICTLLMFAVPVAAFVHEAFSGKAPRPAAPAAWRPTQPPIILAGRWNVGWALNGRKASALEMEDLAATGAVNLVPTPKAVPAMLTSMPTTGWTLDNGATITTDSHGFLVLRPLTNGRASLPGQGKGWRGAYWLPLSTLHWQNYTLDVTITNLGAEGSGGSATVVVGHTAKQVGYAVSISSARITIQNQSGGHLFSRVIPASTSHRVSVTLAKQLRVTIDGSLIATFHTGKVQGGMGFGTYKPTPDSNLPFFTHLRVGPA